MVIRKKSDPNRGGALQLGFFTPESHWKPPSLSDMPSWKGAKRIAIDCEGKDTTLRDLGPGALRDGYTTGWAFAIDGGPKHYLPFRHEGGDNLPVEGVLGYLRSQIKDYEGEFVGANLSYDINYGYSDGFEWHQNAKFRDIQIADPLINELHMSYSLVNIGKRWDVPAKDETILREAAMNMGLDPKKGLWRLPARYVGAYAEQDVTSPLEILRRQEAEIEKRGLREIWDLETDVVPCLVRMHRRGVKIDFDRLAQVEQWTLDQEKEAYDLIHRETMIKIGSGDIWSAAAIAPALEAIGIRLGRTATGQPQIDKFLLAAAKHPVASAVLHARKVNKLRTTFAQSIHTYQINGRIHCSFKQIAMADDGDDGDQKGARYGRLSAVDPNMQQQPSPDRDPIIAGEWRKIFVPNDGAIWGCNDYSQQEPRWTTHFAAVMDLPKAREAAERYRNDPNTDNHDMMTRLIHGDTVVDKWLEDAVGKKIFKVNRGHAKNIFLGLCYGQGGPKLCGAIGMPTRWSLITGWGDRKRVEYFEYRHEAMAQRMATGNGYVKEVAGEEGQAILDNFDAEVPYVSELAKAATARAKEKGFIRTALGRQLNFEMNDDGSYGFTHRALNRIIQGSAADQTKLALVELDRAGHYIQLQVHDEMDGSYESVAKAKETGDIMRDCITKRVKTTVPFKVDTETGPSWGEIS